MFPQKRIVESLPNNASWLNNANFKYPIAKENKFDQHLQDERRTTLKMSISPNDISSHTIIRSVVDALMGTDVCKLLINRDFFDKDKKNQGKLRLDLAGLKDLLCKVLTGNSTLECQQYKCPHCDCVKWLTKHQAKKRDCTSTIVDVNGRHGCGKRGSHWKLARESGSKSLQSKLTGFSRGA